MAARRPQVYFSDELCARYFTYCVPADGAHFVLFDDGATIRKKLQVARSLGVKYALLAYPETADLLTVILASGAPSGI